MRLTLKAVDLELCEEFDVFELCEDLEDFKPTLEREQLLGLIA